MLNFQETVGDTLNLNGIGRKRATVDRTKAPVEVKCMKSTEAIVVHRTGMLSVIANCLLYVIRYCRLIYSTLSVITNCLQEQTIDSQSNRTRNLGTQLLLSGEKEQSEI